MTATPKSAKAKETKKNTPSPEQPDATNLLGGHQKRIEGPGLGLTVRVEINLPADGTKETYDNIFKSIKENLLGG